MQHSYLLIGRGPALLAGLLLALAELDASTFEQIKGVLTWRGLGHQECTCMTAFSGCAGPQSPDL
jgi:hypothetical protein